MYYLLANTFEKTSPSWQVRKLFQRVGEWLVFQIRRFFPDIDEGIGNTLSSSWARALLWITVAFIGGLCLWQLYRFWQVYRPKSRWAELATDSSLTPAEDAKSLAEWLQIAQQLQQEKKYADACRALYMAMIVRLQETKLIPQDDSLTDGEYRHRLSRFPEADNYQVLLHTHEHLKFGNAAISAEQFQACQEAFQAIEAGLSL